MIIRQSDKLRYILAYIWSTVAYFSFLLYCFFSSLFSFYSFLFIQFDVHFLLYFCEFFLFLCVWQVMCLRNGLHPDKNHVSFYVIHTWFDLKYGMDNMIECCLYLFFSHMCCCYILCFFFCSVFPSLCCYMFVVICVNLANFTTRHLWTSPSLDRLHWGEVTTRKVNGFLLIQDIVQVQEGQTKEERRKERWMRGRRMGEYDVDTFRLYFFDPVLLIMLFSFSSSFFFFSVSVSVNFRSLWSIKIYRVGRKTYLGIRI